MNTSPLQKMFNFTISFKDGRLCKECDKNKIFGAVFFRLVCNMPTLYYFLLIFVIFFTIIITTTTIINILKIVRTKCYT